MKRILCYGDSNTWGYVPTNAGGARWDENTRWTGICQKELGEDYQILEDGLGGRTTIWDDPTCPWRNGDKSLGYSLLSQKPIDLVVLCLGINDLKFTNAIGSGMGIKTLLHKISNADVVYNCLNSKVFRGSPKILVLSPITLHPEIRTIQPDTTFSDKYEESLRLSEEQKKAAVLYGAAFLDMSDWASASSVDGLHMDAADHIRFGKVVAEKILEIFETVA